MVGYSRLVEADERGMILRQRAHRNELIDPEIAAHNGRVVKFMGNGMQVEFASVVDATGGQRWVDANLAMLVTGTGQYWPRPEK